MCILCLCTKDITAEGTYSCRITKDGTKTGSSKGMIIEDIVSQPISLTVTTPVDKYSNILSDFYTAQPEVPEDTWPPVSGNTYINLALIKQEPISNVGQYVRHTIRGDADDIYRQGKYHI